MIPNFTIYSDKVFLTANFYIEYLGFNLLHKEEDQENPYIWLELNQQFLLIWPWNNKLGIAKTVAFEVPDVQQLYFETELRTKINVPLHKNNCGKYCFSILDCEDNIIHFTEQNLTIFDGQGVLSAMDLAFK